MLPNPKNPELQKLDFVTLYIEMRERIISLCQQMELTFKIAQTQSMLFGMPNQALPIMINYAVELETLLTGKNYKNDALLWRNAPVMLHVLAGATWNPEFSDDLALVLASVIEKDREKWTQSALLN